MKITRVEIERFSVPLKEPFRVAFGLITETDNWIIRVYTDEGICGLGSAAPLGFVTGETLDTCYLVMKNFTDAFIGFDNHMIVLFRWCDRIIVQFIIVLDLWNIHTDVICYRSLPLSLICSPKMTYICS